MRNWFGLIAMSAATFTALYTRFFSQIYQYISPNYLLINHDFPGLLGSLIGASITGGVAWFALHTNAAVNIRNKRADVILHCNNRYDELYKLKIEIESQVKSGASPHIISSMTRAYFRRYWGLKSDQLDYWFAGYVDPETICSWFMSVVDDFSISEKSNRLPRVGNVTYRKSWLEIKSSHETINVRLVQIMDDVRGRISRIKPREEKYAALVAIMNKVENGEYSLIKKLHRNKHSRFMINELPETLNEEYKMLLHHYMSVSEYLEHVESDEKLKSSQ